MPLAPPRVNGAKRIRKLSTEKPRYVDSLRICHHDAAADSASDIGIRDLQRFLPVLEKFLAALQKSAVKPFRRGQVLPKYCA
jgi:hypothetical protein